MTSTNADDTAWLPDDVRRLNDASAVPKHQSASCTATVTETQQSVPHALRDAE